MTVMADKRSPHHFNLERQDLLALLEVSKALSREHDLDRLLELITDKVTVVVGADRSSLFLHDCATGELWSKIAQKLGEDEIRFPVGVGIAGAVAESKTLVNITNAQQDPRFNPAFDRRTGYHSQSILCVPMIGIEGDLLGVIQVLNKVGGGAFGKREESLLEAFAAHAAVALERSSFIRIVLEKERMDEALKLARDIQMSMLPTAFAPSSGQQSVDISAIVHPAREVGGDFYDFVYLDAKHLYICIGDVSGKGMPAALFMAVTKTLLKSRSAFDRSTASMLTHVNSALSEDNANAMFATLFVAVLSLETGEMTYSNAGHNPPYLLRADGTLEFLEDLHGPLVGAVPGIDYREARVWLRPSDTMLLYTDGVTEATDVGEAFFTDQRLVELLRLSTHTSSKELVDKVVSAVQAHERGTEQADDVTVLALGWRVAEGDPSATIEAFEIRNELAELSLVNDRIAAFASANRVPATAASRLELVLEELVSNIICHAYADAGEHAIQIRLEHSVDGIVVTICDDGAPFNPFDRPAPDTSAPLEEREPGGLGIHLVGSMVKESEYQRQGNLNVVRLVMDRE